ncbi:MAG: hypothetical protein IJC52_01655 [Clostridia bacterium]|nr:hypothetical protein [Clostridia bacterium]
MVKRILCVLLTVGLLMSGTACANKMSLEDVKTVMVEELSLSPVAIDADKASLWYGISEDNCDQAVVFMLTEDLCPGEIVMVKARSDNDAALIAATTSRRLSSLKTQVSGRDACTILQDGKRVAMFFSEQSAALQEIYDKYVK